MTQARKGQPFFSLFFPSFPISHNDPLCLYKQSDAGLSCSIVLFGEIRIRGLRLWAGLNSEFDMAPVQFADLPRVPPICHLADYHAPLFLPDRKIKQHASLDK